MPIVNINKAQKTAEEKRISTTPEADYAKLMKRAGCAKYRMMQSVFVKEDASYNYKGVDCVLNGVKFQFEMGQVANMPEPVYEILKNAGKVQGGTLLEEEKKAAEK